MEVLMKINKYIKKLEELILIILVGTMTVVLIANVLYRFILQNSLNYAEELGAYLLVAVTYLGSGYAVRGSKHIRMTAIMEAMSEKMAKRWSIVIDSISSVAFFVIGYLVWLYMMRVMNMGSLTPALQIPRWITILPVVIGMFATGGQYLLLVAMNIIDKENYWIGTERKFGEPADDQGGASI